MKLSPVERALEIWQEDGLLTAQKASELRNHLAKQKSDISKAGAVSIFSTIGAVLVGLGVLLFVASNWSEMGPLARCFILFLGYATVCTGAIAAEKHKLKKVSDSLWILATIMLGANIFHLGQIFHFSLTFWQGPLLWMIGTLAMGWARQSYMLGRLAVPLALLALGWFGGGSGFFIDDQWEFMFSERGLMPVFPYIGFALMSGGLLLRHTQSWKFIVLPLYEWGLVLIGLPLALLSVHYEVFREFSNELALLPSWNAKQWFCVLSGLTLTIICTFKDGERRRTVYALPALLAVTFLCTHLASSEPGLAYGIFLPLMYAASLGTVVLGAYRNHDRMLSLGAICLGLIIAGNSVWIIDEGSRMKFFIYSIFVSSLISALIWFASEKIKNQKVVILGVLGTMAFLFCAYNMIRWSGYAYYLGTHDYSKAPYFCFVLWCFLLSLGWIYGGLHLRQKQIVNAGMFIVTMVILEQYFSWASELLDRSLAFIVGGILLIVLSIFMEKKRRALIAQLNQHA